MATDFGSDLSCTDDLDLLSAEVAGVACLAQNVYRRLSTPRGMVIDAPDYGYDLRSLLSKGQTQTQLAAIPGLVRAEVLKEERIDSCDVIVTARTPSSISLALSCATAEGPFTLTLDIAAAAVALTEVQI